VAVRGVYLSGVMLLSRYSRRSRIPWSLLQILIRNTSWKVGKVGSVHREGMYDHHFDMNNFKARAVTEREK
jgi:hypothetical protein